MTCEVRLSTRAEHELNHLRGKTYLRLKSTIDELTTNPRPPGCRKMVAQADERRLRVGPYRIVYTIDDATRQVRIRRVAHRRDAYRA